MPVTPASRGRSAVARLAYHSLAAATLLLFASFRTGKPVWSLERAAIVALVAAAGCYWLAGVGTAAFSLYRRRLSSAEKLAVSFAAAVLVFAGCAALDPALPPLFTLWVPSIGLLLLLLGQIFDARLTWTMIVATAVVAGVGLALVRFAPSSVHARSVATRKPQVSQFRIRTSYYDLRVTSFENFTPRSALPRGGLALLADRYLLATGDGQLLVFRPRADMRSLEIRTLAYRVPVNTAEFERASGNAFMKNAFRVGGIDVREGNGRYRVFASHHYWKSGDRCWVMRVSSLEGTLDELLSERPTLAWKTVFETQPCMTLTQPGHPPFEGMRESGGRLAWLPDGRLLVTIGHHAMDGVNASAQASQDAASSFGKIIAINLEDGRSGIYSSGHRNPQGLVVSSAGQVWSTEHGPEGGDELNLIEEGGNYGWPLATYGTEYGTFSWPLAGETGTNGGFIEPYFSWVPSTGVSCLAEMTSPRFERWHGDLLACSLRDQAFWRLRVREGRVVMAERFPFGERIRDVVQGHDGSLVVWNDDRAIQFVTPADLDNGVSAASTFRICASCHVAPAGGAPAAAPSLVGIVGRKVASEADYEYSPALRGMGGNWTRERLDAFIADVSGFAPGTTMAFAGIRDAETRKALIDYLASPEHRLDVMPGYRTRVEGPQELK